MRSQAEEEKDRFENNLKNREEDIIKFQEKIKEEVKSGNQKIL